MRTFAILLSAGALALALVLPAAAQCPSTCSDKGVASAAPKATPVAAPAQECHGGMSVCSGEAKAVAVAFNTYKPSIIDEVASLRGELVLARAELTRLESELAGLRSPAAKAVAQEECCEEQSACCETKEACCDEPTAAQTVSATTVAAPACSEAKQCDGQKACDSQAAQTVAAAAQECCDEKASACCDAAPAAQAVALEVGDCESVIAQFNGLRAELGQVRARISAAAAQVASLRAASAGAPLAAR